MDVRAHVPRACTWLCALAAVLALLGSAAGESREPLIATDHEVKAALLLNLPKYVSWPSDQSKPILCFVERGALGNAVMSMNQALPESDQARVVIVDPDTSTDSCHLMYAPSRSAQSEMLTRTEGKPVLTIGDDEAFVRSGGMIGLPKQDDRICFVISQRAYESVGLRISFKLLRLATVIDEYSQADL